MTIAWKDGERMRTDHNTRLGVAHPFPTGKRGQTPLLSSAVYFYGRIIYIVIIAEPHMKLVSECTETDL